MPEKKERISTGVKRCFALFKTALELVGAYATDDTDTRLSHQRDRFRIWTANMGGHQMGNSSLDYRLRDASNIRRNVLDLLHDLAELLEDFIAIVTGNMTPWDELQPEDDDVVDKEAPETELQQIALHCKDIVDTLLGLSATIRNPAPHDRFMAASTTDVSFYEPHDINHVKESYSVLLPWQVERLGTAISRRRQYFRYRQTHHEKLAFGVDNEQDAKCGQRPPSTLASSIPDEFKTRGLSAFHEEEQDEQEYMSQTSFATSTSQGHARRIPPLPREAETGPFECPFCYCVILAHTRQQWKRHVFEDLRPYVCLQDACTEAGYGFAHRRDWINHTRQRHWVEYSCPVEPCGQRFSSLSLFQNHIEASHTSDKLRYGMSTLVNLAQTENVGEADLVCPFCHDSQSTAKAHHRHVGRHMEQLSLFALPLAEDEDNSEDDDAEARSSLSAHATVQPSTILSEGHGGPESYDGDARSVLSDDFIAGDGMELRGWSADYLQRMEERPNFYSGNAASSAEEGIAGSQNSTDLSPLLAAQPGIAIDDSGSSFSVLEPPEFGEIEGQMEGESWWSQQDAGGTPTDSAAHGTAASENPAFKESLGPKIWTGTHFLPRFVRAAEVPGEGLCYFYDDGTHCKAVVDGERVNAHWGVTNAAKPRKRLAIACITCREKKIKCDPDFPQCVQCEKFGRVCKFKNAPSDGGAEPTSPLPGAAQSPEAGAAGQRQIEEIAKDFDTRLLPMCEEFIAKPPWNQRKRADEHMRLSETVLQEVLLKIDDVDIGGNLDLRQRRKDLIRKVQDVLMQMDVAREPAGK